MGGKRGKQEKENSEKYTTGRIYENANKRVREKKEKKGHLLQLITIPALVST